MNQRKAKVIRRAASELTIGQPSAHYQGWRPPIFHHKQVGWRWIKTAPGIPCRLSPGCTRYVANAIKRGEVLTHG
jgi:hypothetical protein